MLEIKNLKKSFGTRDILKDINLTVKDQEILSIVGPSGAGKTTLLRCITGLEKADSGQFIIDGKTFDPRATDTSESVIGVVFQDFNLFPHLSVFDNITLAPTMVLKKSKQEARADAERLLDQLGLEGKGELYPYQLSGGQKQRVAIARALAMEPKILCYDEPTSALDPNLRKEVENLILGLKQKGMTQLVVTHDMDFAKNIADDIFEVSSLEQSTTNN
jgi:polar amino acid transport system ATP-binding protein